MKAITKTTPGTAYIKDMCAISTIILVYLSLGLSFFALIVFNYSGQVTVTYSAHKQTTKHINATVQFLSIVIQTRYAYLHIPTYQI